MLYMAAAATVATTTNWMCHRLRQHEVEKNLVPHNSFILSHFSMQLIANYRVCSRIIIQFQVNAQ